MYQYLQGNVSPEWVFGQARCSGHKTGYGHVMEEHSVGYIAYSSGARGLLDGGHALACDAAIRVIGATGMLDIHHDGRLNWWNASGQQSEQCSGTAHHAASGSQDSPCCPS